MGLDHILVKQKNGKVVWMKLFPRRLEHLVPLLETLVGEV